MDAATLRLLILVAVTALAVVVAMVARRRRPDPPAAPSYRAPAQIDRQDFIEPETEMLAVVFASRTCDACAEVWESVRTLKLGDLAKQRVLVEEEPELHKRYRIDGVPTTILADRQGVVRKSWLGPLRPEEAAAPELWS